MQSNVGEVRKSPPPKKYPFWYTPNKFQWFQQLTIKKKKKKKSSAAQFHTFLPSILSFPPPLLQLSLLSLPISHFPFSLASLFSFLSSSFSLSLPFFPSSFPFSSFPPSFQNFTSKLFQGWVTRPPCPPLVKPLTQSF